MKVILDYLYCKFINPIDKYLKSLLVSDNLSKYNINIVLTLYDILSSGYQCLIFLYKDLSDLDAHLYGKWILQLNYCYIVSKKYVDSIQLTRFGIETIQKFRTDILLKDYTNYMELKEIVDNMKSTLLNECKLKTIE